MRKFARGILHVGARTVCVCVIRALLFFVVVVVARKRSMVHSAMDLIFFCLCATTTTVRYNTIFTEYDEIIFSKFCMCFEKIKKNSISNINKNVYFKKTNV